MNAIVHASSSRMTRDQGEALAYLVSCERPVISTQFGADFFPDYHQSIQVNQGYRALRHMYSFGLVARAGRNAWQITERGRIALALFLFRRPDLAEIYFDEEWCGS